ncbi:di-trans,poly-cis-decaprenylcistransferase [Candidatus Woesearchaeota archaeon]|nr:di-trans,poly-cis-decaprenylcistransferase [Candidatus Woesearchaeota archaeon]
MIPKHIGIILDGNRRFAKRLMLKPWKGHEWGRDKVRKLLDWCQNLGIHETTLYAFSMQNFNRPKEEFGYLINIFISVFEELKEKLSELKEKGLKVNVIGRIGLFPEKLQQVMHDVMNATKDNKPNILNLAMAYGGREEVIDAVQKIAMQVKEGKLDVKSINEEVFSDNLYLKSEPELIIRTGGEKRTSNFLPWQSTYSEWFFIEKLWPEFEEDDLKQVLAEYEKRERRFGK